MKNLDKFKSPSQIGLALAIIYKDVEISVGRLIEAAEYEKHCKKFRKARVLIPESPTFSFLSDNLSCNEQKLEKGSDLKKDYKFPEEEEDKKAVKLMEFENQKLESMETSSNGPDQPVQNQPNKIEDPDQEIQLYQLDPDVPPMPPKQTAFGMDEMMPSMIYLILDTQPTKLMRLISLVENFGLPSIKENGQLVEYALRTLEGAATSVASGRFGDKKVERGVVKCPFKIVKVEK